MRLVNVYLVAYFILLAGALVALWQSGVLRQLPPSWIAIGLVVAVGLGVVLAVTSRTPTIPSA